jgi:hypothetical protein
MDLKEKIEQLEKKITRNLSISEWMEWQPRITELEKKINEMDKKIDMIYNKIVPGLGELKLLSFEKRKKRFFIDIKMKFYI